MEREELRRAISDLGAGMKRYLLIILMSAFALLPQPAKPGEPALRHINGGLETNASPLDADQTEPFIAVAPRQPRRIVTVAIDFLDYPESRRGIYISSNGGRDWSTLTAGFIAADPSVTVDDAGTFWVAGLGSGEGPGAPESDVAVARIAPGTASIATEMRILRAPGALGEDKPMISIDNSPASPTYGRLYAAWNSISAEGSINAFTYCDTRVKSSYLPQRCDDQANWATPFALPGSQGYTWGPDIAAGPEGEVYVVWDAVHSVLQGVSCHSDCTSPEAFTPSVIAQLVANRSCHSPFGRAGNSPTIDVDISRGPNRGRVYVTWTDAAYPCSRFNPPPGGPIPGAATPAPPKEAYIASALNALPGGPMPSAVAGTLIYEDGETDSEGVDGADISDEFFPQVGVDEGNGATWVSFYSTRLDPEREGTNVYVRRLRFEGDALDFSTSRRVSSTNDLSDGDEWDMYYGHYAALDVARGWPYPVWISKTSTALDVFTYIPGAR